MKKFLLVLMTVCALTFGLTACNNESKKENELNSYVSYSHEASYVGENEKYTVICEAGKKEEVFVDDGKIGKIVPFCTVIVVPKKQDDKNSINVKLTVNGKEISENLPKDMFTENFEKSISTFGEVSQIEIENQVIKLQDVMKEYISRAQIMKIVRQELKEQIDGGYKDGKFCKEFYIKLIRDNDNVKGSHYWYVALIDGENSFCSMLLDAKTGEVLSKKTT